MITSPRSTTVQIFISIRSVGASLQIGEILWFCDFFPSYTVFFSRTRAQVEPVDGFLRFLAHTTCFCPRTVLLGLRQYRNSFGDNIPQKLLKKGVNRQFQAKPAEYKNRDILQSIKTINVQF